MPSAVVIAGVRSGVGKTTIASGIMGALARRGLKVQPFKAGPDYIDPHLSRDRVRRTLPQPGHLAVAASGSYGTVPSVVGRS